MDQNFISPDAIDDFFIPAARSNVTSVDLEGEGLLYDEERGTWHLLNPTAMVIWRICDGSGSVEELAVDLADAYGADPQTVREGTLEAVRQLGREGLLYGVAGDEPDPEVRPIHEHRQLDQFDQLGAGEGPHFLPVPPST